MKFRSHAHLTVPPDETKIWRYMDLAKFLDLVVSKRVFFTNMASLTDRYEGAIPDQVVVRKREELVQKGLSGRDLEEEVSTFEYLSMSMAEISLVNCWSIGDEESYALWKVYLRNSDSGVAVCSTVGHLREAIENGADPYPEELFMGQVHYSADLAEDQLSRFRLLTRKTPPYKHERELRLLILNYPMSEGGTATPYRLDVGRYVRVDISELIQEIYSSPFSGRWFHETLKSMLASLCPEMVSRLTSSVIKDK